MNDQASALRQIIQNMKKKRERDPESGARVVCVTSGKGGVGKTNFAVNFSIALAKKGLRVLLVDADFGLANVDVILGLNPEYNLSHVIRMERQIMDVITEGPCGIRFVSGGSGVEDLLNLSPPQLSTLADPLLQMEDVADVILFDTGAGLNSNILRLIEASSEVIVITTPEPTAIMDAYALVKTVCHAGSSARLRLVVNRAESVSEAMDTLDKFAGVLRFYLKTEIDPLGYVLTDSAVKKAVRLQQPFVISFPKSLAARNIDSIAWRFMEIEQQNQIHPGLKGLFREIMRRSAK